MPLSVYWGSCVSLPRRAILNLLTGVVAVAVSDCAGSPVLERQVLGYDEVNKTLDDKLVLLNIARVANIETVHFTATSSMAATFNWTATLGAGGRVRVTLVTVREAARPSNAAPSSEERGMMLIPPG